MKAAEVIVIGSGIAGLSVALEAAEHRRVLIVTKAALPEGSTRYAQGGIAAVLSATDSPEKHIADTLQAGCFYNDPVAVRVMVEEGPALLGELFSLGVPFDREHGGFALTLEAGHGIRRIAHCGDRTGDAIEQALVRAVLAHERITVMEHAFVTDLLCEAHRVVGCQVLLCDGTNLQVGASAIVLATGGCGQVYGSHTTNPSVATGDGLALACRVGAELRGMEFMQFHPTVLAQPGCPPLLLSESLRGEGAVLVNAQGERFLRRVHPSAELATRDIIARALWEECRNGPVFLDLRGFSDTQWKEHFFTTRQTLQDLGINPCIDLVPVAPAAHYCVGGIVVDLWGQTGIPGLFAVGECASTGVHGANRLASNSLLEGLVFGNRVGRLLCENLPAPSVLNRQNDRSDHRESGQGDMMVIRRGIGETLWKYGGIVRSGAGLEEGLSILEKIAGGLPADICYDRASSETRNLLFAGRSILTAALARPQSLGAHYRSDTGAPEGQ